MKILVPVDGSKSSMEALKVAVDFAKTKDADISLINVMSFVEVLGLEISPRDRDNLNESLEKRADFLVQQACGVLAGEDVVATCKKVVASDSVHEAIINYAETEKFDLIIMGSRGGSSSDRFKLGSVATKVVRHSPCSVYVVKA